MLVKCIVMISKAISGWPDWHYKKVSHIDSESSKRCGEAMLSRLETVQVVFNVQLNMRFS